MKASLLKNSIAALALYPILAQAGAAPVTGMADAVDMGSLDALGRGDEMMTVTLPLTLRDPAGAEAMMIRVATPGDPLFHQFLTPAQIRAEFGPDDAAVARAMSVLTLSGFRVERATSTTLKATGSVSALERVFQTELHQFATPAASFHAPIQIPTLPASLDGAVQGLFGLSDAPKFKPLNQQRPAVAGATLQSGTASTGNPFGELTVQDFAALYDVNPLYAKGLTGAGRTLGIVTFASFTQSDVELYWNTLGLTTKPNRVSVVEVDGGSGPINGNSGETSLDIEQSGGLAPEANIVVYEAPLTCQGFLDNFAKAADDNLADTVSVSWGGAEIGATADFGSATTDPFNGETVPLFQSLHQVFVLMALQGQTVFAAAGDSGAFTLFPDFPTGFSIPLSVLYPASDSALAAAGGTTLPGTQTFAISADSTVSVTNPVERVWGLDYLEPLCDALGVPNVIQCGIFPEGTGGGISVLFPVPPTQLGLAGVQLSQPGQSLVDEETSPPEDFFDFAADFPGRNLPDISANADPQTGYEIFVTSPTGKFQILTGFGGTSFVAPQFNGVTALLGQNAGHRFGLITVPIYTLARSGLATLGPKPALRIISTGDNWFFTGRNGFSPAAGLGTIDAASLAQLLK